MAIQGDRCVPRPLDRFAYARDDACVEMQGADPFPGSVTSSCEREPKKRGRERPRRDREGGKGPRPMTAKAPNILIVMADQMAPAFLPIYGHPLVRAPNMQALARQGVVFDSAYCASPLCAPSRASFMSGLLPSRTRVYDNAAEFARRHPDLRAWLARARLSHHPLRQDALLRTRSAAWLRAAPDDRHLSRRLQLDARLGSPGASSELVSQHELGSRRRLMRALEPARLRR